MDGPRALQELPAGTFRSWLDEALPVDGDALDLGTGTGRVALHVAPRVRSVVGVDIDKGALEAARWVAQRAGIVNARFVDADAEQADLVALNGGRPYALATARLFFSLLLIQQAAAALAPGGLLLVEALAARQWHEAGGSKWGVDEPTARAAAASAGLDVLVARTEETRQAFPDLEAARTHLKERRLWPKWREDGRWDTWRAHARAHGWSLTEAHLLVRARRRG